MLCFMDRTRDFLLQIKNVVFSEFVSLDHNYGYKIQRFEFYIKGK